MQIFRNYNNIKFIKTLLYTMDTEEEQYIEIFTSFIERFTQGVDSIQYKGNIIGTSIFLLNFIGKHPKCTMSDVKKFLRMIPSAATRRIEKLVNFGLVKRIQDKEDRRLVRLNLTKEGTELYQKFFQSRLFSLEMMKQELTQEELTTFFQVLKHFNNFEPGMRKKQELMR